MMKLCRLCFLVLVISSISRGQEKTTGSPAPSQENGDEDAPAPVTTSPALKAPLEADNTTLLTRVSPSTQSPTPENATDVHGKDDKEEIRKADEDDKNYSPNKTTEGSSSTKAPAATSAGVSGSVTKDAGVRSTTDSAVKTTTKKPETDSSSWGYVILAFIILVIIVLCIILYFLRRVSRTYSFDLQRQDPIINQFNEPTGTFEPVYLDDLDRPAPKDLVTTNDPSPPPAANGTSVQLEEKGSNGENAPQEQPDANGLETSPSSDTSPTLDDDTADKTSNPPGSIDLMFDG